MNVFLWISPKTFKTAFLMNIYGPLLLNLFSKLLNWRTGWEEIENKVVMSANPNASCEQVR